MSITNKKKYLIQQQHNTPYKCASLSKRNILRKSNYIIDVHPYKN